MASAETKFNDFCLPCIQFEYALIARELSGFTCTRSLTMNSKFSINFSLIVSELVQVNTDNSLAECVNLSLNQIYFHFGHDLV